MSSAWEPARARRERRGGQARRQAEARREPLRARPAQVEAFVFGGAA